MDLGKMALQITADPSGFNSGLLAAQNSAVRFGNTVNNSLGSVGMAFGALAGSPLGAVVALTGALARLGQQAIKEGAEQARLMTRYGLTSEQVAGLELRSRQMGIAFQDVQDVLPLLTARLGHAADHGGDLQKTFERLGLDGNALARLPVTEAMGQIGDALKSVQNPAQRAALEMEILGRHGQLLRGILKDGSQGMAAAEEAANRLGLGYGKAAQEMAALARAQRNAQVAIQNFEKASGPLAASATSVVAAQLGIVLKFFSEGPEAAKDFYAQWQFARSGLGEFSQDLVDSNQRVNDYLAQMRQRLEDLADPIEKQMNALRRLQATDKQLATGRGMLLDETLIQIARRQESLEARALRMAGTIEELNRAQRVVNAATANGQFLAGQNLQSGFYAEISRIKATMGIDGEAQRQAAAFLATNTQISELQRQMIGNAAVFADQWRLFAQIAEQSVTPLQRLVSQLELMESFPPWTADFTNQLDSLNADLERFTQTRDAAADAASRAVSFREMQNWLRIMDEAAEEVRRLEAEIADVNGMMQNLITDDMANFYGPLIRQFLEASEAGSQGPQLAQGLTIGSQAALSLINQNGAVSGSDNLEARIASAVERQLESQRRAEEFNRRATEALENIQRQGTTPIFGIGT